MKIIPKSNHMYMLENRKKQVFKENEYLLFSRKVIYDKIKAQKGDLRKKKMVINFKIGGRDGRKGISK